MGGMSAATELMSRVPPSLRELFARSQSARRIIAVVAGIVAVIAGIALMKFQWSPPLSHEELQSMGLGVALCALGLLHIGWTVVVPDPALEAFVRGRITWIYVLNRRGEQYAVLNTADGSKPRLRLDRPGVGLEYAQRDQWLGEIAAAHPGALAGFTQENQARYASMPRQPGPFRRRTLLALGLTGVTALVTFFGGETIAKALDPSRGPLHATIAHVSRANQEISFDVSTNPGAEVVVRTIDGDVTEYAYEGHVTIRIHETKLVNAGKNLVIRVQNYARPPGISVPVPGL